MKKQKQILIASWLLTMLIGTAVLVSAGDTSTNYQPNALLAVKTEKAGKKVVKKKSVVKEKKAKKNGKKKKTAGKFKANKTNCALIQRWLDAGVFTKSVLARGWPYTGDTNDDGIEELLLVTACTRAGFTINF